MAGNDPKDPTSNPKPGSDKSESEGVETLDGLEMGENAFDLDAAAFDLDQVAFDAESSLSEVADLAASQLGDEESNGVPDNERTLSGETFDLDASDLEPFPEDFSQPQEVSHLDDLNMDIGAGRSSTGKRLHHATDVVWSPSKDEGSSSSSDADADGIKSMETSHSLGDLSENLGVDDLLADVGIGDESEDSSSLEELGFDSLLGGDDDFSDALGALGGDSLDLDVSEDDTFFADGPASGDSGIGTLTLDLPDGAGPGLAPNVGMSSVGSSGARGAGKEKKSVGKTMKVLLTTLLLILAIGVSGAAMDMGFFYVDLLFEDDSQSLPPPPPLSEAEPAIETTPVAAPTAVSLADVPQLYEEKIAELRATSEGDPEDVVAGTELLRYQLMYRYRWPGRFDRDDKMQTSVDALLAAGRGKRGAARFWALLGQVRILDLWGAEPTTGKSREQLLDDADKELADLNPSTLPAGRRQLYKGLVFQEQRKDEVALDSYNLALAKNSSDDLAMYLKAALLLRMDRVDEAQVVVNELVDLSTKHRDARLLWAELALARKGNDGNPSSEGLKIAQAQVEMAQKNAAAVRDGYGEYEANLMRAVVYGRQEDTAKQMEALEQAAKFNPRDEQLLLNLASNDLKTGDAAKSVARLKACPQNVCKSAGFYLLYVEALLANEQSMEAEEVATKGIGLYPKEVELLLVGAAVYEKGGNKTRAAANYNAVINMSPNQVDAYLRLATIYADRREYQGATDVLNKGVDRIRKATPNSDALLSLLNLRAQTLMKAGWLEKARDAFSEVVSVDETQTDARMNLALLMSQLGDYAGAVKNFEVFYRQRRHNPNVVVSFGYTLIRSGQPQRAIKELTDFLRVNPGHLKALIALGYAYEQAQDFDNAELVLREAHRVDPSNSDAYFMTGRLELSRERQKAAQYAKDKSGDGADFRKAVVALSTAVEKDEENLEYRELLAQALTESGDRESIKAALEQYDRIIQMYLQSQKKKKHIVRRASVYFERALLSAHATLGRSRMDVLADFREATVLDPARIDMISRFAEEMYLAQFRSKNSSGDLVSEAESYFEFVLSVNRTHVRSNYYLGRIRLRQWDKQRPRTAGNKLHDSARVHLERVVTHDQGKMFPVAYKELADIYKDRKMYRLARRFYQEYLKVYQRQKGTPPDDVRYVRKLLTELR